VLVFLTNHLNLGATTIAAIYKERWQIEIFFKALKQNLKIKTFVGTSASAVKIQIWTALGCYIFWQEKSTSTIRIFFGATVKRPFLPLPLHGRTEDSKDRIGGILKT
jgi:hypothetical protein